MSRPANKSWVSPLLALCQETLSGGPSVKAWWRVESVLVARVPHRCPLPRDSPRGVHGVPSLMSFTGADDCIYIARLTLGK